MRLRKIEIIEKDNNKKGDLFGRLMSDLLHTLGYDEPRLNIHKSGREIDLNANHRAESKIAIAECKAHSEPIGGSDVNKFVGVVDVERRKLKKADGIDLVPYFISLSGFKETAIEQEKEVNNKRVILIKPEKIVDELIAGRILVSKEEAISSLSSLSSNLTLLKYADLLAYDKGWVWAFYFSNSGGQEASHFGLVHAEGKPLIKNLAESIVSIDMSAKKLFDGLLMINKDDFTVSIKKNLNLTRDKYFKYLENELGDIQFEGLPTDKEAGSVKVKLENIFVPLHLSHNHELQQQQKKKTNGKSDSKRESIGEILTKSSRLAILAKPGAGKSTLIKRIAIAYAFPERRIQINDSLPERNWFPIFLRCRELGDRVTQSITEIIHGIPTRAEIPSCINDFSALVSDALQNGDALLLIDGLDEISEDKNRIAFVNQLRTFIATYPTLNIIITSREAGFRVVGGSLASYCENYSVSNLVGEEIEELCLKWHKSIIDDSENTMREANKLSEIILKDSRIKVLAENPLLLTTLLFVKRWAGYLPTKKSVLYQEMIKLLLVTWNVEGHEILDIEEAEPQLAFVAYWMTKKGKQTISADELNKCLIDARKQMPEILGYTNITPSEFIKRVESRSSLLIMTGHKRNSSGHLSAIYEFLHLSFQEYLTSKAIVKKFIPQSDSATNTVDIIKPNITKENWKEVIPLVAVLLERDTKELIEYLISELKKIASTVQSERRIEDRFAASLLGNCLANEIQVTPALLETAIEWFAKSFSIRDEDLIEIILKNKFGNSFKKTVREHYFKEYNDKYIMALGSTLSNIFLTEKKQVIADETIFEEILSILKSKNDDEKCIAILGLMSYSFQQFMLRTRKSLKKTYTSEIFDLMYEFLEKKNPNYNIAVYWCVTWAAQADLFPSSKGVVYTQHLVEEWTKNKEYNYHRVISWALSKIIKPKHKIDVSEIPNLEKIVQERFNKPENDLDQLAAIYIGTLIGSSFDEKALAEIFNNKRKSSFDSKNTLSSFRMFAKQLGIQFNEEPMRDFVKHTIK